MRTNQRRSSWRRVLLSIASVALAASGLSIASTTAARADTTSATGDESVSVPAAWQVYTGETTSQISTQLSAGYRLVDVHRDPSGSTYTVAMVKNSGAYAVSSWWWYVGATQAQLSTDLTNNNARMISVEQNSSGTYDAIMVANTGSAARTWWWYTKATTSQLSTLLTTNNARMVSVQPDKADTGYTAIMVSNTGADAKTWWWYVGESTATISSQLSTNNARIVDLSVNSNGTYNVVMVRQTGNDNKSWQWYVGSSATKLVSNALQHGYRIFDIEPYTSGGNTVYAAVQIDNLAAENRRIENIFESGYSQQGLSGSNYGFYVKPIGGNAVTYLSNTTKYEPASGIKALYNLYAQYQVQLGNDSTSSSFDYWYKPSDPTNKDVCPLDYTNTNSNKTTTTLEDGLDRMMQNSDNRTTQGVDLRYGRSNVNNFAKILGLKSTAIRQTLGCGIENGGYVTTSLNDLTKLYEGVFNNTMLNAGNSASFFGRMLGGTGISASSGFGQMVTAEAAKLGKSGDVNAFLAAVQTRDKGGSYDMCFPTGNCSPPYDYVRSDAGIMQLPYQSGGNVVLHPFTYGWWVNNLSIPCAFSTSCAALTQADNTTSQFTPEIFRHQVDLALQTWS